MLTILLSNGRILGALKKSTRKLKRIATVIGLSVNGEKKYLLFSGQRHMTRKLKVNSFAREIKRFKYLGAMVNKKTNNHEDIIKKIIIVNRYYFGLSSLFKAKFLGRRSKSISYKDLVRDP